MTADREFLVLSRGQWDADARPEDIQRAIDSFYVWLDGLVAAGRMRRGQRLAPARRIVTRGQGVVDGPFGEAKEVIGGYWFVIAPSLDEAAALAAGNPCLRYGLSYEIRPIEHAPARADVHGCETPPHRGQRGDDRP
ncbi:YciI family protein [Dokdonella sp.]|uniref:YciI family protein n=1 Tax=Dokdonella sp. TaxID=2291710 RepID=UPI002F425CD4